MNRRVWWVLRDYVGRTLGLWLLVLLAQFIQSAIFWAAGISRVPLLAAVIASLAYRALAEKPHSVLRIVPLTDTDGALIRRWGAFGLPVLVMGVGIALAASPSVYKQRAEGKERPYGFKARAPGEAPYRSVAANFDAVLLGRQ